uniref:DENN domain and WD repeat-containing protein SCD1-like n=1 Tax=Fragaria vesca subsp. vesca TaxID=101020 RepID=UPI0005C980D7|nr:PREDICTED: DENN domain and WD repeat-containing protein SCD1-like [Fragaria vesca subsp. vesca]
MAQIFEHFVVCGIGPEIRTLDGGRGFHGFAEMYLPHSLSSSAASAPHPGVSFYSSGFDANDATTFPRSYPIVLTEGEDIAEDYCIPANSFADKCICLVSQSPSLRLLKNVLEELFALVFPLAEAVWLSCTTFQPLVQCLDVDNLIKFFTAVLLERRILIRSHQYSLLTLASEAICYLIYPFRWQQVYIPLLFFSGVDYIDAPTPYMMGLHSGIDTSTLAMDGVVIVDLEFNRITTTDEIPSIPEPELSCLRQDLTQLLYPNVVGIDLMKDGLFNSSEQYPKLGNKPWGEDHDLQLRLELSATHVFNVQAFLKMRSRSTQQPPEPMLTQFLESRGFMDYLERGLGSDENNNNLLDKLQDAIGRGQNPISILPSNSVEPEIITIADTDVGTSGTGGTYTYDRFPSNIRTEEEEEKRKQTLAAASEYHSLFIIVVSFNLEILL